MEIRLRLGALIDQTNQKIQLGQVGYWKQILRRLISIIRVIATQNLALRGSSDSMLSDHNGLQVLRIALTNLKLDEKIKGFLPFSFN
jgi:hypothetical protein